MPDWPPPGIDWAYTDEWTALAHGDCREVLPMLEPGSVDLVLTDPPYFRVKGEWWDRQWDTRDGYLAWIKQLCQHWQRLLKPNGSLYCFASPQMAAHIEVTLEHWFRVLNRIRWVKDEGWHKKAAKEDLRVYLSPWEEVLFCEHRHADSMALGASGYAAQCEQLRGFVFEPLRAYLEGERRRAGIHRGECDTACGVATMASRHYFSTSQWCLPTREHYQALQHLFNDKGLRPAPAFTAYHPEGSPYARWHVNGVQPEYLRADYEDLRADYEDLRADYEDLRRPFAVSPRVPYTDVWNFRSVPAGEGKHPCEKPQALLQHIITVSSRPGAVALDCFAGSGSTLVAAKQLGRRSLGVEIERAYIDIAIRRLRQDPLPLRWDPA